MMIAEIHGKLPSTYEGMEDIVTSNVFSTFRYLRPDQGLLPFLQKAVRFTDGSQANFLNEVKEAHYIFWPRTTRLNREPDLLLVLTKHDGSTLAVVIEAKYKSGKSNIWREDFLEETEQELAYMRGDQLAEQYIELINGNITIRDPIVRKKFLESSERYLIYVTAHYARPKSDIHETYVAMPETLIAQQHMNNFYWLNWMSVIATIEEVNQKEKWVEAPASRLLVEDLKRLLERKGLVPFHGYAPIHFEVSIRDRYFWNDQSNDKERAFFSGVLLPKQHIESRPYFWRGDKEDGDR